jgi:hypothetical protein
LVVKCEGGGGLRGNAGGGDIDHAVMEDSGSGSLILLKRFEEASMGGGGGLCMCNGVAGCN